MVQKHHLLTVLALLIVLFFAIAVAFNVDIYNIFIRFVLIRWPESLVEVSSCTNGLNKRINKLSLQPYGVTTKTREDSCLMCEPSVWIGNCTVYY